MRTSTTHPLQIAFLQPLPSSGQVGLTFCPGKKQPHAATGAWDRDLGLDLDAIAAWGAVAVVTLVEEHELRALRVKALGAEVAARHLDWLHLPIADVSVPGPAFEAAWAQVGESLRARLRDGFSVLVHCKGGLGRAGMVAARLLSELGVKPRDAVHQVRAARPGAIETEAQLAYVLAQQPVPEPLPSTSAEAIRSRAVGCLLGLAVGDAVGTTLEFTRRGSTPLLTDMVGGGPFRLSPGEWTDDTAMALVLADSLLAHPDLDERDLMTRSVEWHEHGTYSCTGSCFDIGITTRQALSRWKRTDNPIAGSTDPNTAGNGSLMRLAPVAVRHWPDRARLRDVAARQSRTTHAAPEAVDACVAYAELLADAIAGQRRSEVLRARADLTGAAGPLVGTIGPIMAGSWRGKSRHAIRASGYVAHSLEAALWSVGSTGDFRSAVLRAANLGEDADTTAAITGQLVGALFGASGIPKDWRRKVAWSARITGMAERLLSSRAAVL
jgi:ADP-ribosyl-[dinitrogen reductase] hydrolase